MTLAMDERAVETIPLRLMIVAVVAALSVLPAAQALETLRNRDFLDRASQQLDLIAEAIGVLSIEGPGSVRTLMMDFSSSGGAGFASIRIGGVLEGPNSTSIVLALKNGGKMVRTTSDDGTPVCSASGGSLLVLTERFSLRLSAEFELGQSMIMAEAI